LLAAKLPQLVIPTTPTTASVKAGRAIFDPVAGERLALFDPKTRVHAVFVHPDLVLSAPKDVVVSAALDALTLAIEGLTSRSGDPLSDAQLMHTVRLVAAHLPNVARGDELAPRAALMHAAILCGLGSDHTGAGMATVLGHAIGARHEVGNGTVKAIVLPHVIRFNAGAAEPGLVKIAMSLNLPFAGGASSSAAVIAVLEGLFRDLGVPRRPRDAGVPHEALPEVASLGMGDWFLRGNPRPVRDASELQQVLEQAW